MHPLLNVSRHFLPSGLAADEMAAAGEYPEIRDTGGICIGLCVALDEGSGDDRVLFVGDE